ncbi:PHD finger protein 20-like protein 1 [Amphibalanus amphitrite]|uniref:PHD finger protein 20-like protein 1 n=1 Tax=Amphibalanus amphitrite TaxID=1232801 RepID=A0A6A4XEI7_AMPAM|nr:PHD finger protein 20-like protein 1 [Amphibalanus amphitrite]
MADPDGSTKKKISRPGFKFETGFRIELLETGVWRQDSKKHFRVREDVFAVWSDGRRYPGSIQAVLPNDTYQVMFFDGFMKKLKSKQLSKWTRENEQRFGAATGPGRSALPALPNTPTAIAGPSGLPVPAPAPAGFVPEVLDTKRKRKTNPIVEELLGPKRARRQMREESESRHRSPSGAPSTGSAASTPGGSSRKQSWAISSREDADGDSADTGSEWDSMPEEEGAEYVEDTGDEEGEGEEEEEAGSGEEESVYSESVLSLDDTASSSYRSASPPAPTPSPAAAPPSPADPTAEHDLPPGWRRVLTPRTQTNRLDITLFAPDGTRFRSRAELERFVQRTGATHLEPSVMFRRPPRSETAGRRRRQSPLRSVGRPSFTSSMSVPSGGPPESGGRPLLTSTPSLPGPAARGMYVAATGTQKKLPLGWALEPIIDKPAEPEQQDFVCVDRDCNKKFRNESLLQMHIKHYHPELRHLVNARSASVVRRAESRTMQSQLSAEGGAGAGGVPSPRLPLARLRSVGEPAQSRERRRGSSGERAWPPEPPPRSPPPRPESPPLSVTSAVPPTDDPKLLAEPVVSVRSDVSQLAALHHARSVSSERQRSRSFRRPRRRQNTSEEAPSQLPDFIQIVEQEGLHKSAGRRPLGRLPRRPTDSGESGRLLSYTSLEEVGSPSSPAPSATSTRDADAGADEDLMSEPDKLEHHEVIRCSCGHQEEDGLMIQCELCLAWQHGVCLGIDTDDEVPSRYVCATCRHPWRVRHTQRYVWDQQLFRDGALLRLPFGGADPALERAQAVMRAACDLTANVLSLQAVMRSLRTKLAIASDLNHPKLYLWARPWSPPPEQSGDQSETIPAGENQSQAVTKPDDQLESTSAAPDSQSGLAPGGIYQSDQTAPPADQSESLLAAALESPALLAAVNSAAAELTAAPAGLDTNATSEPGELNGAGPETDPLATLSSDQKALLTASLAAVSDAVKDAGSTSVGDGAAAGVPAASEAAPAPTVSSGETAAPASGSGETAVPAADSGEKTVPRTDSGETAAGSGEATDTVTDSGQTAAPPAASAETPADSAPPTDSGEAETAPASEPLEETDDPLSGVLDAIVGLLPSQSDLDQLMDGPVTEPTPAPPAAPVGEARIDPATCQVNLLQHVTQMQTALMTRMDVIERHVDALEKVAELEPDWEKQQPQVCRAMLHSVMRDVRLLERLGRLS